MQQNNPNKTKGVTPTDRKDRNANNPCQIGLRVRYIKNTQAYDGSNVYKLHPMNSFKVAFRRTADVSFKIRIPKGLLHFNLRSDSYPLLGSYIVITLLGM